MRSLAILAAFLAMLFAGCGTSDTATKSAQPEQTTADTAVTGSARPETTEQSTTTVSPDRAASSAPAGWASAVGDSVMLGAIDALEQEVPDLGIIDDQGSRQVPAATDVLQRWGTAGWLGDATVVHIGNNGPFTAEEFDEMMRGLSGVRKVLIVNLTVPSGVEDPIAAPNDAMLAEEVQRYPNAVLVDWRAASAGHPEFFSGDEIHLSPQGAQAYAGLIAGYLEDPEKERSATPPGPQERTTRGEGGFFGECVGPPSWCAATVAP